MRLDSYLVRIGLVESRNKAQQLIKEHAVSVDGKIIDKVSFDVVEGMAVELDDTQMYVSRAAIKLKGFSPHTDWDLNALNALDIGSRRAGSHKYYWKTMSLMSHASMWALISSIRICGAIRALASMKILIFVSLVPNQRLIL